MKRKSNLLLSTLTPASVYTEGRKPHSELVALSLHGAGGHPNPRPSPALTQDGINLASLTSSAGKGTGKREKWGRRGGEAERAGERRSAGEKGAQAEVEGPPRWK